MVKSDVGSSVERDNNRLEDLKEFSVDNYHPVHVG
jgi:hypothetical protein